jgi:hypothetical protein
LKTPKLENNKARKIYKVAEIGLWKLAEIPRFLTHPVVRNIGRP